jgi:hypothetical protein
MSCQLKLDWLPAQDLWASNSSWIACQLKLDGLRFQAKLFHLDQ